MKKFIVRTMLTCSLIFVFLFTITMFLEYKNKDKLNTDVKVEYKIEDGEIVVPDTPKKVEANYQFSQVFFYSGLAITLLSPLLFLKYGGIEIIKKIRFKKKLVEGASFCFLYGIFTELLIFPKILFSSFYRAKLVGLSIENFSDFMARYLQSILFYSLEMLPIAMIIYIIFIKRKRWYIYVSIIVVLIGIGGAYISPYIDEMQNDLVSMEEGELKNSIVELAKDSGIEDLDIRVIEKSNTTKSINAYMTGIGKSRRIVFWDTTLKLSKDEILSVAAHEMGHYNMNHIQKSMLLTFVITIMLIMVTHIIMLKFKGRDYRVIDNIPKILFILNILFLVMSPIETVYSRKIEYDADQFAMEATNDGYTNGSLEIKFIQQNLSPIDVNSLYKWLVYDHPTVKDRIEHSNEFIKSMK